MHLSRSTLATLALAVVAVLPTTAAAQVTTSSVAGTVTASGGAPVAGARITATHTRSGTVYTAQSRADGRYVIPAARVGGPYTITARLIGYSPSSHEGIMLDLGVQARVDFNLTTAAVTLGAVSVTAEVGTFSGSRTGAATKVGTEAIAAFPTISRTITDFTRLTPQSSGSSFAGMDNRFNNITIDGSYFNNSFGLAGQPGGRTNVAPIPVEAVEQIQVNIAPFDVRQGNFVGAGVNAVTRSGTNEYKGSLYYVTRNQGLAGNKLQGAAFNPGKFNYSLLGAWAAGPIIKDKLFFFTSFEDDKNAAPGTTFLANKGGETVTGNTTRVLESDLQALSTFLSTKFNYETGPYAGYDNETPSRRFLLKLDYNVSDRHKLSVRHNTLTSESDQLISNSSSLGFGNRRTNSQAMSYQASGYLILENINSTVAELTSQIRENLSNDLLVGYTSNDESRGYKGAFFPTVDILQNGSTYISFGMDPFTPNNQLRYRTFQLQDNVSYYVGKHDFTLGVAYEKYHSDNVFYQGANSVYIYNSLADFYTDANDYLANKNRTASPITLNRFQVQYVNIPGLVEPLQPLDVNYWSGYVQDSWRPTRNLNVTLGLRFDRPSFGNTAYTNTQANGYTFRDRDGNAVRYQTQRLPEAAFLWSPRVGFNWDVTGDKVTQVRGGTGVFTGKPAYVWVSNQIGNNGILTGAIDVVNTKAYPFNPDAATYKPATVSGTPAASYTLNFTEPDFRFPQVWRTSVGVDRKLPWGIVGTLEAMYSRDVNGMYYTNANLPAPAGSFAGADKRPRWNTASFANRVQTNVTGAYVLGNQDGGYAWNWAASAEKSFNFGLFAKASYSYGVARNTHDPSSIAAGNWTANAISGNPNQAAVAYSQYSPGHRYFLALSYKKQLLPIGPTSASLFLEGVTQGNASYTFSGDANGDGAQGNDLLYIPRNTSEMNFEQYTSSGTTFTVAQQQAAWEAFIEQDKYLKKHRGEYAERGAVFLPMLLRADFSVAQEVTRQFAGKGNSIEVRLDILNVGNLINDGWGVSERLVSNQPLIARGMDANGQLLYRLRNFGTSLMKSSLQYNAGLNDTYRMQLSVRYKFY
jgi:hypothetical protein